MKFYEHFLYILEEKISEIIIYFNSNVLKLLLYVMNS